MIVNKYQGNGGGGGYTLPTATASRLGGVKIGDGIAVENDGTISVSGGSIDSGAVMSIVDGALSGYTEELEAGDVVVGMSRQLYSPDGVESDGYYDYRTTAGSEDVGTGKAELRAVGGHFVSMGYEITYEIEYTAGDDEKVNATCNNDWALAGALNNTTGEYTYEYDGEAWSPELPDCIDVDGKPESGAVITINYTEVEFTPLPYKPDEFVSVGLNQYNKDADTEICTTTYDSEEQLYTIMFKPVPDLADGYVIYDYNASIEEVWYVAPEGGEDKEIETEGGELCQINNDEGSMIKVIASNKDGICIHPRWSGIKDDEYESYSESRVDISAFPSMYRVNDVTDYVDLVEGEFHQLISAETFSWARAAELQDDDIAFDTDGEYIYTILDDEVITPIAVPDFMYDANDFGVEYYAKDGMLFIDYVKEEVSDATSGDIEIYTENFYMNNLVDKLRRMEGVVHLNDLQVNGDTNTVYECDGMIWLWDESAGPVAEWSDSISSIGADAGYGLIFSKIPNTTVLFEFKYTYGGDWRKIVYDGGNLYLVQGTSTIDSCTLGNKKFFSTSQYNFYGVDVYVLKHWIGLQITGSCSIQNIWDGNVSGAHWMITDHSNYPYINITTASGIAKWNSKGQVVKQEINTSIKTVYFNNNGYNNNCGYIVGNGGGPNRLFVPTQSGVQGQVLTSAGDGEPTWQTMIKAVKITSDAYEALATKDPNTLYLIDDE